MTRDGQDEPPNEPLPYWTLQRLAAALARRALSPVEVTQALLSRIEALDPRLHAFVTVTEERALEAAKRAEAEIAADGPRGPLHGVPIALKDLCATRGVRTTAGTRVLADWVPDEDATVVARLAEAGAVSLGKLAMTEGAFAAHHPDVTPPVNPWDAAHWTGISSSGSGVAAAAGLCFGTLGSDTGGSIRYPSACNALVGIKPTWGRVSRHGIVDLAASLDHVGPMARSVGDAAVLLQVIAGADPRDRTALVAPVPDYAAELGRDLAGVRIGIDEAYCAADLDAEMSTRVLEARHVLGKAGAELRAVRMPPVDGAVMGAWLTIGSAEIALAHEAWFPERADDYGPQLRAFIEAIGQQVTGAEYARAHQVRLAFRGALDALFQQVDLILCPALALPLPAGADLSDVASAAGSPHVGRFTMPFDLSGSPTITLPCGFRGTLPVGLQLVGRHLEEGLLIRAAHAYERATSWHAQHPAL